MPALFTFKAFSWPKLISLAGCEVVLETAYLIQGVGIDLAGMVSPTVTDGVEHMVFGRASQIIELINEYRQS